MFLAQIRRHFRVQSRTFATSNQRVASSKKSSGPNPLGFVLIAALSFGALAYVTKVRESDPDKDKREKRRPLPNPLVPELRKKEEQV